MSHRARSEGQIRWRQFPSTEQTGKWLFRGAIPITVIAPISRDLDNLKYWEISIEILQSLHNGFGGHEECAVSIQEASN